MDLLSVSFLTIAKIFYKCNINWRTRHFLYLCHGLELKLNNIFILFNINILNLLLIVSTLYHTYIIYFSV